MSVITPVTVRINNATVNVNAEGFADGRYRLHTDRGRFAATDSQTAEVSLVNGQASAALYGYDYSVTTNDATVWLRSVEGSTFASTNYTVLWVEISMRCGQDEPFSEDNDCAVFPTNRVLGAQITNIAGYEPSIGNVVEIVGQVHPPDFAWTLDFRRDNIAEATFVLATNDSAVYSHAFPDISREVEPDCNDPCSSTFCDGNPSTNGYVYNIDTPGVPWYFLTAFPYGSLYMVRLNFVQYAVFNNKRCSDDFFWFTRTTAIRTSQGEHNGLAFFNRENRPDDNVSGPGRTNITW